MALILDTGPLYASIDQTDKNYEACRSLLESHPGSLIVPTLVVAEVTYFVQKRLDHRAEVRFLGDLSAGAYIPEPVAAADWLRVAELVARYHDLSLGTTDASVVAAAERLGIHEVATLDRRHFTVVQPRHGPLQLLP